MNGDGEFSVDFGSEDGNFELGYGDESFPIEPIRRGENADVNGSLLNISAFQDDYGGGHRDAESIMRNGYAATPIGGGGGGGFGEEKSASGGSRLLRKRVIDRAGDATPVRSGIMDGGSEMKSDISFPSLPAQTTPTGGRLLARGIGTPNASPGLERQTNSTTLNFPPLDGGGATPGQGSSIINFPPLGGVGGVGGSPATPKPQITLNFPPLQSPGEAPPPSPGGRFGVSQSPAPFVPRQQPEPFVPEPFVPPARDEPLVPAPREEPFVPRQQQEPFVPSPRQEPFVPGAPLPLSEQEQATETVTPTPILKSSPFLLRKSTIGSASPVNSNANTNTNASRVTFEGTPQRDDLAQTQPIPHPGNFGSIQQQQEEEAQSQMQIQNQISSSVQIDRVERRLLSTFDKAASGFRRMFGCELSSIMRPNVTRSLDIDVDSFCEGLIQDINDQLQLTTPPLDVQIQSLGQRIAQAIDDETVPVISRLSATSVEDREYNSRLAECLKRVRSDIETLKSDFRSGSEGLILCLESERDFTIAGHERDKSHDGDLERRLRQLKYTRSELETKATHQKSESDSLYRGLKSLESRRRDFLEETLFGFSLSSSTSASRSTNRILSEIKETRREIASCDDSDVFSSLESVLSDLSSDTELCRRELMECEVLSRRLLSHANQSKRSMRPAPSPAPAPSPRRNPNTPSRITTLAQQRIEESRRSRMTPTRARA